jgi:5-hydroxyisourate hydrolase-like protein (transthyretin family)
MNKTKLLITTALAGVVGLAGVASAEVGGSVSHTMTFSSDDTGNAASPASENRLGTELNLTMSGKKDLDNGMFAAYSGKLEIDGSGSSHPDHEYESQFGMGNFYIGIGNDGGNKLGGYASSLVSYAPQSLVHNVAATDPAAKSDSFLTSIDESDNISANFKAANGLFTVRYTPNTGQDHGNDIENPVGAGASGSTILYKGQPVDGLTVKIGQTSTEDTGNTDAKQTQYGASYNFGQFTLGFDVQDYEASSVASTSDKEMTMVAGTYAVSDAITLGATFHTTEAGAATASTPDEEAYTLSVGYNLGGAAFTASYVNIEDTAHSAGSDYNGLVLTSSFKF